MESQNPRIKIKIDQQNLDVADLEDIRRWENEGGYPSQKPPLLSSLDLPLHEKEIFEVVDYDIIAEDGQLYLLTEINMLSLH